METHLYVVFISLEAILGVLSKYKLLGNFGGSKCPFLGQISYFIILSMAALFVVLDIINRFPLFIVLFQIL